jgi:hypothetical protein
MAIALDQGDRRQGWAVLLLLVALAATGCSGSTSERAADPPANVAGTWVGHYAGLPESARAQGVPLTKQPITLVLRQ